MPERHSQNLQAIVEAILNTPGATDSTTRQAIFAQVAALGGQPASQAPEVPAPLAALVERIARHAPEITDEEIAAVLQAGFSEDALFEITISAAVGAGYARWQRGLSVLKARREG